MATATAQRSRKRSGKVGAVKRRATVTLTASDAAHVYEWLVFYWTADIDWQAALPHEPFGGCYSCQQIAKRLVRVIGRRQATAITKQIETSNMVAQIRVGLKLAKQQRAERT